jgi:glycosyltransferase involved in cell wall biosynthesis
LTQTNKNVHIIPNIVSEMFKPVNELHEGFRFVTAGRLVPVKQYDKIVNAFLNIFGDNHEVTLSMAGDGEEHAKIQQIIDERDSNKQVKMLGEISREQIVKLIRTCDALIVFSELETFCVPVIEAWACGKPVITTTTTTVFAENPDPRLGLWRIGRTKKRWRTH